MLSARELNSESLPNRTWINEHLTFTHGYGLTLGPVNEVTLGRPADPLRQGHSAAVVGAGRHRRQGAEHLLRRADEQLRAGEHAREGVPLLEGASRTSKPPTAGTDGVRIGGIGRKLLFSLGFQSLQILFSNDITADSRVLYHRNITDRVTTIAPFLRYDDDPYLVVSSDGRLFWIRDAYTTHDPVSLFRRRRRPASTTSVTR